MRRLFEGGFNEYFCSKIRRLFEGGVLLNKYGQALSRYKCGLICWEKR